MAHIRTTEKVLFNVVMYFQNAFFAVFLMSFDFVFIYYRYGSVVVKPSVEPHFSFNICQSEKCFT
jgi:hypothetical protein